MKLFLSNFRGLLRRFQSAVYLNCLVLIAAFAVVIIVGMQLKYDLAYNRSFKNYKKIFTAYSSIGNNQFTVPYIDGRVAYNMQQQIPEIEKYCLLLSAGNKENTAVRDDGSEVSLRQDMTMVSGDFLDVFSVEIVKGSSERALREEGYAIISESTAKIFFGDEDPIGKIVSNKSEGGSSYTIDGIYKDFPENTSLHNGVYLFMVESLYQYWMNAYFTIDPQNADKVTEKIYTPVILPEQTYQSYKNNTEDKVTYKLEPIKNIHLFAGNSLEDTKTKINSAIILFVFGILVLIIAFVSFINISIAMVPSRIKNLNIHKIHGVGTGKLCISLAFEPVAIALVAFLFSLFLVFWFSTTSFTTFFSSALRLSNNISLIILIGLGLLLISFLVGLSIGKYAISFEESVTLKGSFALSPHAVKIRNVFISIQFIFAITLVSVSIFIKLQHDYLQNSSWGFKTNNIIYIATRGLDNSVMAFTEEVSRNPHITNYAMSANLPGDIITLPSAQFEGKDLKEFAVWAVSPNFLEMAGIPVIQGQNFTQTEGNEGLNEAIVNNVFLQEYGLDESIIGKQIVIQGSLALTIVGVSNNIHYMPLDSPIKPLVFYGFRDINNYIYLQIAGDDKKDVEKHIKDVWEKFSNKELIMGFLDEHLQSYYAREQGLSELIGLISIMIFFIAIMGVYGMIIFNARYKTKEIAIRKANGSTIGEIILILNKSMLIILAVSFVIATAISVFAIHKWLENYALKLNIPWWLYPVVGIVIVAITATTVSWESWKAASANPINALKSE